MKKHCCRLFVLLFIGLLGFSIFQANQVQDVSAASLIKSATVKGHTGAVGHTKFIVKVHFDNAKNACDGQCKQVDGKFPCIEHGDWYTSSICKWKVKKWKKKSPTGWQYYEATLYSCHKNQQNMRGTIGKKKKFTLTLKAVNTSGKSLSKVKGLGDKSKSVYYKKKAALTRSTNSKYTFKGFAETKEKAKKGTYLTRTGTQKATYVSGTASPKQTYNVRKLKGNKTIFAVYDSAKVTLNAYAILAENSGSYKFKKDLNSGKRIDHDTVNIGNVATVDHSSYKTKKYSFKGWRLSKKSGSLTDGDSYSKAISADDEVYAVYVEGDPNCEDSKWATVSSEVKNSSLEKDNPYAGWRAATYAKPTDDIHWNHIYCPGVQSMADEKATNNHINESAGNPDKNYTLKKSKLRNLIKPWQNQYTITTSSNFSTLASNHTEYLTIGKTDGDDYQDAYDVPIGKAGQTLVETITTGTPIHASIKNEGTHSWPCKKKTKKVKDTCAKTNKKGTCTKWNYKTVEYWSKTCKHTQDYISHTYTVGPASSHADVVIPYNFFNRTKVVDTEGDDDDIVYAGETRTVKYNIATLPKDNDVTDGTYATAAPGSKTKFRVCYDESGLANPNASYVNEDYDEEYDESADADDDEDEEAGYYDEEEDSNDPLSEYYDDPDETIDYNDPGVCLETTAADAGTLNSSSNMGGSVITKEITVNIPDINAGSEVCVRSAVWPAGSGADTNASTGGFTNAWAWAKEPVCFTVAKKPNMQVWGGNVYSRGDITTQTSVKGSLKGYNVYGIQTAYTKRIFGSWSELGVIAGGKVIGFGSGASLGYQSVGGDGVLWPNYHNFANNRGNNDFVSRGAPGGTTNSSFCYHSILTFANATCSSGVAGQISISTSTKEVERDKAAVIARLIPADKPASVSSVDFSKPDSYYYSTSNLSLGAANLATNNSIKVVHSTKDIYINGDLQYTVPSYTKLSEIPKLVIYAEGNIYINCGVTRIDGLIISDGSVLTCNNLAEEKDDDGNTRSLTTRIGMSINSGLNSNQLVVNGAIIANQLYANRTYGAATGANSIVPAEIINFDPTLYFWAGSGAEDSGNTGGLNESYIRELPPRR